MALVMILENWFWYDKVYFFPLYMVTTSLYERERPSSAELSSFFSYRSGVYWKNFHEVKKTKKKRDEKVEDQRAIGTVSLNCI